MILSIKRENTGIGDATDGEQEERERCVRGLFVQPSLFFLLHYFWRTHRAVVATPCPQREKTKEQVASTRAREGHESEEDVGLLHEYFIPGAGTYCSDRRLKHH